MHVDRQMRLGHDLLQPRARRALRPLRRRPRPRRLRVEVEREVVEALQQAAEHEGRLVVRELLAEADARAGVEGEEDEGVGRDVFRDALVEEAVWVEEVRWST